MSTDTGDPAVSVSFVTTAIGQSSTALLHVENTGTRSSGTIAVAASGDFQVIGSQTTCAGAVLAAHDRCDIAVQFHPTESGTRTGQLIIAATPGATVVIELTGTGAVGTLALTPAIADLGDVGVGTTASATIQVSNASGFTVPIDAIAVSGSGFSQASTTCGPTLMAASTCDVVIAFTPTAAGGVSGALAVTSQGMTYTSQLRATATAELTVTLAGAGSGSVTSSPAGIDCGATCTAAFSGDVQLTAVAATGSVFLGWSDSSCSGTTCTVAAASLPRSIAASFGVASVDLVLSPAMRDFGVVRVGTGSTQTFQLANQGTMAVPISSIQATGVGGVSGTTCGIAIPSGSTCTIDVTVRPSTLGAQSGSLQVDAGGQLYTSQFTATGADVVTVMVSAGGKVTSSPAGIDCGTTCSALFSTAATLTATPDPGYMFLDWSVSGCTGTSCDVSPGSTVTARFVSSAPASLSIDFSGGALGEVRVYDQTANMQLAICSSFCSLPLTAGDTILVTSSSPSNVGGLTGACTSTGNECQLTANGAATITASFPKDPAERWTLLGAQASTVIDAAFDDAGNLFVVQTSTLTKLDPTGAIVWSRSLAIDSFVVAASGLYATSGGNLLFIDASGTTQASHPFTGTLQFLAPNGDLVGTTGNGTTEWAPDGSIVRTLAFGPVNGLDSAGTFYQLVSTAFDYGGTPFNSYSSNRWASDGSMLAAFPEVAPNSENTYSNGLAVGGDHVVAYSDGVSSDTYSFGWEAHAPDGSLEASATVTRQGVSSLDALPGAAMPAGTNEVAFYYTPDYVGFTPAVGCYPYGIVIGWATKASPSWITTTVLRPLTAATYEYSGDCGKLVVGGPHGEVALIGQYTGLYDFTTLAQPTQLLIQTFYP